MNTKMFVLLCYMVVFALSGCALTTDRIELQYLPQQNIAKLPGASNVSIAVKIDDHRQDRSKVSSKKNGYGMEMAPIIAVEEVTVTIQRAIVQELRSRGFRVDEDAPQVQIVADLIRFYNDHKLGFFAGDAIADLNMSVKVKSNKGDLLYSRQIVTQGIEENTQLATGENARLALNKALENGIKKLFEDQSFLTALLAQQ